MINVMLSNVPGTGTSSRPRRMRKFGLGSRLRQGAGGAEVSAFRIRFTLDGGTGLFTSPPSDNLELALRRAEDLERRCRATIHRIVESEGYFFLDRDGCTRLLLARAGRG
jgi:hypothetical protein